MTPTRPHKKATKRQRQLFLESFAEWGNIRRACRVSGLPRGSYYFLTEHDAEFSAEVERCKHEAREALEEEAMQRAKRPYNPSDTLLIFLLKGIWREKYGDTAKLEHSGPDGGAIEVINMTPQVFSRELPDDARD